MKARRSFAAALTALCLAACYADLDWREVRVVEADFSVWLPARPSEQARPLTGIEGAGEMHQWSARARDTAFAAGYADMDRANPTAATEFSDALVHNIAGRVDSRREISLGELHGIETIATGSSVHGPLQLRLRVYTGPKHLYQIATLGKPGDLSGEESQTFFDSFRPGAAR
jgi:hypothetical protein